MDLLGHLVAWGSSLATASLISLSPSVFLNSGPSAITMSASFFCRPQEQCWKLGCGDGLYYFCIAIVTNCHELSGLNNGNLFSDHSRGEKSGMRLTGAKIRMSEG